MSELLWDPTDPEHRADPYPRYELLRKKAPVWRSPVGYWVLSRHDDIAAAMLDSRFSSHDPTDSVKVATPGPDVVPPAGETAARFFSRWMTFSPSAEAHRRLRRLMLTGFTPARMSDFRPRLEQAVDDAIDAIRGKTDFDFMAEFAGPLPVVAICEVLGVPAELRQAMHGLGRPLARAFHAMPLSQGEMVDLESAITAFQDAILSFLGECRRQPNGSFISSLAVLDQREISEEELVAGIANLFFGGHHTSVLYLGNGMLSLLRHPDQAELLRKAVDDDALTANAAEELLRYDSPAQTGAARFAAGEITMHDEKITSGETVLLLLGSANRDPEAYDRPEHLDLLRPDLRTVALGRGGHSCIGAPLARLEGQIAFPRLVRAFPDMKLLPQEIQYGEHSLFRGPERLLVTNG